MMCHMTSQDLALAAAAGLTKVRFYFESLKPGGMAYQEL